MKSKSHGFTLIELLVVIAIISVLAIMTIVGLVGFKERAQTAKCGQQLRSAGMEFFRDHHELDSIGVGVHLRPMSERPLYAAQQDTPGCPYCGPNPSLPTRPAESSSPGVFSADTTALNVAGLCPKAGTNPMYALDPENEPEVRSFGMHERVAAGRRWDWMLADSDFETIVEREELAADRHDGKVNVFGKDGSVTTLPIADLRFADNME